MSIHTVETFSRFRPLFMACVMLWGLTACTNVPVHQQEAATVSPATPAVADQSAETVKDKTPQRPHMELTQDLLYKFLVAEIAGQRGQLDLAVTNYLELAAATRDPEVVARATRVAVYAGNDQAAEEAARLWLELDPAGIDAHQVLAIMDVRKGNIDGALVHFDHIVNHAEEGLDQKLWVIANLLEKEKDQAIVRQLMERLMQGHENDPEALYAYAHVLSRLNDDVMALEMLEKVLALMPDNVNANISYVSLLQQQGKGEAAMAWMEKALQRNEKDFSLRMFYARLLTDERQYDAARRQFEILIAQNPNNTDVLYALGLLYLQSNRLDEAATYFQRLSDLGQHGGEAGYYLGRIAEEKGDLQKAADWYRSLNEGVNYFDAQVRLGVILARQDKMDDARRHLQGINVVNQEQKNILVQAEAELLTDRKLYDDAMEVYDRALASNNQDSDLLYARAMLAEKMGRLDILERDLKEIIRNDPNHTQALNALGYTLADQTNRHQEAYELIRKALDLSPDDFYILDSMGWVLYRMGRLDEAIVFLNKALAVRPDPEIAAHLGEVLWVKGDKAAAKQIWEAA
ncbi:MAG: tetratricopeptide repeat protein, partial [Gammaproteobacteria bacterium]